MLGISPLQDVLQIFSPSVGLVFSFFSKCLLKSEVFKNDEVQLTIIFSWIMLLVFKNSEPNPKYLDFSPVLFCRSFIVSCFTFRSRIHFELIFVNM